MFPRAQHAFVAGLEQARRLSDLPQAHAWNRLVVTTQMQHRWEFVEFIANAIFPAAIADCYEREMEHPITPA